MNNVDMVIVFAVSPVGLRVSTKEFICETEDEKVFLPIIHESGDKEELKSKAHKLVDRMFNQKLKGN